jgi:hypothetical protein
MRAQLSKNKFWFLYTNHNTLYIWCQLTIYNLKFFGLWGEFHESIYALRLQFALCAPLICTNYLQLGIMHLRLAINFLNFLLEFSVLYSLHCAPNCC